ncbi:MAG: putative DNA binding domain-containing protein [Calditrichaeota bacterium]|nr:putative DNA binding domain-containing protein [Calditrichota bacterium]
MRLWEILKYYIETGQEARKVDLKQTLDLSSKKKRTEFAKDIAAMANTGGGSGYLIIGVLDQKHREGKDLLDDYVVGYTPDKLEVFEQQIVQALENNCSPVPEVHYEEINHPNIHHKIGVIVIPRSFSRPYIVNGEIYIRRGTHTFRTSEDEVKQVNPRILINFAREVDELQIEQLRKLLQADIDEIINVPSKLFDNQPYLPQVRAMIDAVVLTPPEWQSLPLVVNIHPFAPAAAAVLAWIHGLRGFFPEIVRMARNEQNNRFEVVEVLLIQSVRNETRNLTVKFNK